MHPAFGFASAAQHPARRVLLCASAGSAALLLLAGGEIHAQSPSPTSSPIASPGKGKAAAIAGKTESITVSGQSRAVGRRQQLEHTASSISELTAEKIAQKAVTSTRQIANLTPNLYQPRVTVGYSNANYFIRGIGELDPQGEPSVGSYLDGVYIPRTIGTMQELLDIDAIEIDRGPVGFTTGHQAEGGAVRINTVVPDDATRFTAQAGYGSYNEVQSGFAASGPIIPDTLYFSLAAEHHQRDGIDHNDTLDENENDIDYTQARGKLRYTPNQSLSMTLAFDGTSDGSTNRGYGNLLNADPTRLYSQIYPKNTYSEAGFTGTVSALLDSHLSLRSITAVRGYDDTGYYDNTGDFYIRNAQLLAYKDRSTSQDLQLNGNYGRLTFTSGVYLFYEDWTTARRANNSIGTLTTIRYQPVYASIDQQTHNAAWYGLAQYKILPSLTGSIGLRWNWEEHSNSETLSSLGPTRGYTMGVPGNLQTLYGAAPGAVDWRASAHDTWAELLPKGALDWSLTPGFMPYVSISQGSKSAGYDYRAQTPTALGREQALLPYGPETVTTYEAGAKGDLAEHRVNYTGAFFYNDFQNIQITTVDPTSGLSHRYNAGYGHSLGAELEGTVHVTPAWEVDGTGSYLFAQLDHFNGVFSQTKLLDGTINNTPHSGERLPYSPRWQMDLSTDYRLPIPVPGRVRIAGDISFQSSLYTDALANTQTQLKAQSFVNALVSWNSPDKRWTATLSGRNLLDRRYIQSLTFVQSRGIPVYDTAAYNDPRTLLFTLRYTL